MKNAFKRAVNKYKLLSAITAAIAVSLLLTVISVSLYVRNGTSRLDLSRPGYEQVRSQVNDREPSMRFDSTGPINANVLDEFHRLYKSEADELRSFSSFKDSNLSDRQLQLSDQ